MHRLTQRVGYYMRHFRDQNFPISERPIAIIDERFPIFGGRLIEISRDYTPVIVASKTSRAQLG